MGGVIFNCLKSVRGYWLLRIDLQIIQKKECEFLWDYNDSVLRSVIRESSRKEEN